eukprot:PITA_17497
MFILGPKKYIVFVVVLEDHGYDVIFNKQNAFLRHIATRQVKQIKVRVNNLYKIDVEDCVALRTKAEKVQSRDVNELWHIRLGHLHHGAFNIMQHITTCLPKGALEQHDTCKGYTLGKYIKATFHDWDIKAHNKDETLSKFVEFKALVEKEMGKKVKALRRDNGGEYM